MNNQKNLPAEAGVTLIITFLIMTILLAIVLSISSVLFNQMKMLSNIGYSISAFYASESGVEKTLYYDRKVVPTGGTRGFCSLCQNCDQSDCQNCTLTPLDGADNTGCDVSTCNNCEIVYTTTFDDKRYEVNAKITPEPTDSEIFIFDISAWGYYRDTVRAVNVNLVK